ncbi:MAG: alpha/beta hydrolase [Sandaracinaceae bacterium]|nr:alpha/beta hydrolase [Sandaracinaceae bacterium]
MRDADVEHRRIQVADDVCLHVVHAGAGTPVVLLHGFPQFWWAWRYQIPALVDAGYHVIAPDLRGYNDSDKPHGVKRYRMKELVADVRALIKAFGYSRVNLVAHDWGGVIAFPFAARHPEMLERLIVLNAPHPAVFMRELRTFEQLRKSWYVFAFQLPRIPEYRLGKPDFAARIFRGLSRNRAHFTDDVIARFRDAIMKPGARTAMLNYYRASMSAPSKLATIKPPTRIIWGEEDVALGLSLLNGLDEHIPGVDIQRVPNASHWVNEDAPERVNELIIDFLRQPVA